ncbi:hypothetical protein V2G26_004271 [Clonostachys chloroleuca]
MEAAGTVVAINRENKTDPSVGDLVVWKGQGAYSEYSTADIDNVDNRTVQDREYFIAGGNSRSGGH